jgi:hypothetical protein
MDLELTQKERDLTVFECLSIDSMSYLILPLRLPL